MAAAVSEATRRESLLERRASRASLVRRTSRGPQNVITFAPRPSVSQAPPDRRVSLTRRPSRVGIDGGVHFPPIEKRKLSVARGVGPRKSSLIGGFPALGENSLTLPLVEEASYFDEIPENLPREARFCATLSLEAQFASLKGYEDVLFSKLQDTYPDYGTLLSRTKTPAVTEMLTRLKSAHAKKQELESDPVDEEEEETFEERRMRRRREREKRRQEEEEKKRQEQEEEEKKQLEKEQKREQAEKGFAPEESTSPAAPTENQKRVSYRFQNAMDILDTLKQSTGELVTSSLEKKQQINPLKGYSCWSSLWANDFKFQKRKMDRLEAIPSLRQAGAVL